MNDSGSDDPFGEDGYFEGALLVAAPNMPDPRFARSVIFLCAHSDQGAMGLIVNKPVDNLTMAGLLERLDIPVEVDVDPVQIHVGGPVETERGFVLHSTDYSGSDTVTALDDRVALTATVDILRAIGNGTGPAKTMLALGYSGWMPGQLEQEIRTNGWLLCPADESFLFGADHDAKWTRAIEKIGINPALLSSEAGQA